MTTTLVSLISILIGIVGANTIGLVLKKYSFGIIGNTIAGVFGSVFFIKSLGRLGFDPMSILETGNVNITLFIVNSTVSFCGGIIALFLTKKFERSINRKT